MRFAATLLAPLLAPLLASLPILALAPGAPARAEAPAELVAAAKAEGQLTVIALPHDWCGYGPMMEAFKARYGIRLNELNPDAGSGDELEAIRANRGNRGPQAPDVIDVGLPFGTQAASEGLLAPYKVSTWDSIPADDKAADGAWTGDYYGVLAFEVNRDIVKEPPADWADLLKPEYADSVALAADPRTAMNAILAVYAAGLSETGGDAAEAAGAGLDFFAKLAKGGNFVPVIGKAASLTQGSTPIVVRWDYLALTDRDTLKGNPPVDIVVPKTAVVAGIYVQAISAFAPHPNAAKLWMEQLYSDEGQTTYLSGYCHPIRYPALVSAGKLPAELVGRMPPAEAYAHAVFPTLQQQDAAKRIVTSGWDRATGANVK